MTEDATVVDATGLKCPLPVLKARKAMRSLADGTLVEVRATDPAAPLDFRHFCNTAGHAFVSVEEEGDTLVIRLRKATVT
jgi:tRNA 2-thiouridine synthesizing protein A